MRRRFRHKDSSSCWNRSAIWQLLWRVAIMSRGRLVSNSQPCTLYTYSYMLHVQTIRFTISECRCKHSSLSKTCLVKWKALDIYITISHRGCSNLGGRPVKTMSNSKVVLSNEICALFQRRYAYSAYNSFVRILDVWSIDFVAWRDFHGTLPFCHIN